MLQYFGSQLHPIDRFFLFLHKLRGLLDQGAANKFNTAASTVSRMVITYYSQNIWPTREHIKQHMPAALNALYPDTRVVIDCTEIDIQCPSSMAGVPRRKPHRRSGLATLPSVGAIP